MKLTDELLDKLDNVTVVDVPLDLARAYLDGEAETEAFGSDDPDKEDFDGAIDQAQGSVRSGAAEEAFVIIRIRKD